MDEELSGEDEIDLAALAVEAPGAVTIAATSPPDERRSRDTSPSFLSVICALFSFLFGLRAVLAIAKHDPLWASTWVARIAFCSGVALEVLLCAVFAVLAIHFLKEAVRRG